MRLVAVTAGLLLGWQAPAACDRPHAYCQLDCVVGDCCWCPRLCCAGGQEGDGRPLGGAAGVPAGGRRVTCCCLP